MRLRRAAFPLLSFHQKQPRATGLTCMFVNRERFEEARRGNCKTVVAKTFECCVGKFEEREELFAYKTRERNRVKDLKLMDRPMKTEVNEARTRGAVVAIKRTRINRKTSRRRNNNTRLAEMTDPLEPQIRRSEITHDTVGNVHMLLLTIAGK